MPSALYESAFGEKQEYNNIFFITKFLNKNNNNLVSSEISNRIKRRTLIFEISSDAKH